MVTMTLNRVWTPSPNYSSGGSKRLLVIHTMEGFTGPNGALDCARYFQGNVGASSQVCIDNNRGTIWECVNRGNGAWTQCSFNSVSDSMEQSGYASWSKSQWLNERNNQLHNVADWIAEESAKLGIPITRLTASQAQSGGRGICGHSDLGSSGCGHSDPGANWPWTEVLEWAKGGTSAPIPPVEEDIPMVAVARYSGHLFMAGVATDNKVKFWQSGYWANVDLTQTGAKLGSASLAIDDIGEAVIGYVNGAGAACTYETNIQYAIEHGEAPVWRWSSKSNGGVFG